MSSSASFTRLSSRRSSTSSTGGQKLITLASLTLLGGLSYIALLLYSRKRKQEWIIELIDQIEETIQRDEGNRGIKSLIIPGELEAAARELYRAKTLCIMTGFPCLLQNIVPCETDGPPGAFAIARACIALGIEVYLLTDQVNEAVLIAGASNSGLPGNLLHLESFPCKEKWGEEENQRLRELASQVDVVVAIEKAGPSIVDGTYYTMRGRSMNHLVAPIERILTCLGKGGKALRSIGIGDGGNEVGMGKVKDAILASSIPNAETICCAIATDHLIVSSVSNWGGYALAAALAIVAAENGQFGSNRKTAISQLLVTRDQERELMERIVEAGARDGITGECLLWVDGLPLDVSLTIVSRISRLATAWSFLF